MIIWIISLILVLPLLIVLLFFTFLLSLFIKNKEYTKHSKFYRFLLNLWTFIGIKIMRIKIHTSNLDKIPDSKNILFVGNHKSNFDPIITWYVLKKYNISYLSKEENFKIPIFGKIIRKCCFLKIDRKNPKNALVTLKKSKNLLDNKEVSIGVYPEGTRNKKEGLLMFHNGVFKIAKMANSDIVVVKLSDVCKIHKNFPFHKSDIYLDIVKLIPKDDILNLDTKEIGNIVYESLSK